MKKLGYVFFLAALLMAAPCIAAEGGSGTMVPQALEFLPPPPEPDSPDFARDKAVYEQTRELQGSTRWELATFDANIENNAIHWFDNVLGVTLSKEKSPATYDMLYTLFVYVGGVDKTAKAHYQRPRPYMYYNATGSTCAPWDEEILRSNGSYPSGHSSRGWAMALALAGVVPDRTDALMERGLEIGQSRVICGFHWQSDVEAGRLVAAAALARLSRDAAFTGLLEKAGAEIQMLREQK